MLLWLIHAHVPLYCEDLYQFPYGEVVVVGYDDIITNLPLNLFAIVITRYKAPSISSIEQMSLFLSLFFF
jgi:hypothetical protein